MRALNLYKARWRQLTVSLFTVFFSLAEKYSFSESSSSILDLWREKKAICNSWTWKRHDRGKKRTKLDTVVAENVPFCSFKVLAQFKLPTFNGTAPTVQNYPFVGLWKVLYLRTNSVVVGKIQRNLKPRVLVAVAEPSIDAKSRRNVQLLYHCFLTLILIYNE